ncbi:ATP-dependent DNA helicase [Trichonephila clavipes]|nr:ATP-dependent DNA helicase [Trichonephila clavipes]
MPVTIRYLGPSVTVALGLFERSSSQSSSESACALSAIRQREFTARVPSNFGELDIILIGYLRQLPPVRSSPIYKQPKQTIVGPPTLWQILKFYEPNEVMHQANQQLTSILTKIGNGEQLDGIEITLIESRFCTVEEAELRCPQDTRLFNTNDSVNKYNTKILNAY